MGYSRRTSNYSTIIALSDLTYIMSMIDLVATNVEKSRINNGYSLEFTELIRINP